MENARRSPRLPSSAWTAALLCGSIMLGMMAPGQGLAAPQASTPRATPAPAPAPLPTPVFVPLSAFTNRPASRLAAVQVKLTYLGPQKAPVPTVVFHPFQFIPDMAAFKPYRLSTISYANDERKRVENFSVNLDELLAMLRAAGTVPAVQAGRRSGDYLSFMVVDTTAGQAQGFEAVLNKAEALALVRALDGANAPTNGMADQVLKALLTRIS